MLTHGRGFFGRGDMQKEFEEASFALEKGQVSKVVETASGLHLIQRYAWHGPCPPNIQH
jgi:NIMA-interacting peptidyl-prolyl cis-trans isomerase 1